MKRFVPAFAAILLIFGLVFVKHDMDRVAPSDSDAEQPPPATALAAPAAPSKSWDLLPEEAIGSPTAKYKLAVGWYYDETNQPNLKSLQDALQALKNQVAQSQGTLSLEIVDIDVPPEDRSAAARAVVAPGIAVNGVLRPEMAANPGEGGFTAENAGYFMQAVRAHQ